MNMLTLFFTIALKSHYPPMLLNMTDSKLHALAALP
jgi:hypothetical protein